MTLSKAAKSLWAKLPRDGEDTWLPLSQHMEDAAEVAERLWEQWLPYGLKTSLDDTNKMDSTSFLQFDITSMTDVQIKELSRFVKSRFDMDNTDFI